MDTGAGFSCYFFVDSIMAFITAARRPPRSSAATPTMVAPGSCRVFHGGGMLAAFYKGTAPVPATICPARR